MKFRGMITKVKICLMTFSIFLSFFVNVIGFELQPMGFLMCDFFVRFVRKSVRTFISTPLLLKPSRFCNKMKNVISFYVKKKSTSINFMLFRSKLAPEIAQRVGSLYEKKYINKFHGFPNKTRTRNTSESRKFK